MEAKDNIGFSPVGRELPPIPRHLEEYEPPVAEPNGNGKKGWAWNVLATLASTAIVGMGAMMFNTAETIRDALHRQGERISLLEHSIKAAEERRGEIMTNIANAIAAGERSRAEMMQLYREMDKTDEQQTRDIIRLKDQADRLERPPGER